MEIDIQYFPLGHSLTHSRVLATTWSRFVRVRTAVSKMSPSWKRFFCLFFLQLDFPLLLVIMLMSLLSRSKKRFCTHFPLVDTTYTHIHTRSRGPLFNTYTCICTTQESKHTHTHTTGARGHLSASHSYSTRVRSSSTRRN